MKPTQDFESAFLPITLLPLEEIESTLLLGLGTWEGRWEVPVPAPIVARSVWGVLNRVAKSI
jgi:hypothetical protein